MVLTNYFCTCSIFYDIVHGGPWPAILLCGISDLVKASMCMLKKIFAHIYRRNLKLERGMLKI